MKKQTIIVGTISMVILIVAIAVLFFGKKDVVLLRDTHRVSRSDSGSSFFYNTKALNDTAVEVAPELPGEYVSFSDDAFKIRVPAWWKQTDVQKFSDDVPWFRDVQKVFINDNHSCALVYSSGVSAALSGPEQAIPAVQVTSTGEPFGSLPAFLSVPENNDFQAPELPGVQKIRGATHFPYSLVSYAVTGQMPDGSMGKSFYLVAIDGKRISKKCESEVRSILQTFTREFPQTSLTKTDGRAVVAMSTARGGSSGYFLFLSPQGAGDSLKNIFDFPKDVSVISFSENAQTFYYYTNKGKHSIVQKQILKNGEIETKEFSDMTGDLVVPDATVLVNFFLAKNSIYYVTGTPGCLEYMGACATSLFVYDKNTKVSRMIAGKLTHTSIVGLSGDSKEILMRSSVGDAGCWNNSYTRVAIQSGDTVDAGSYGGCSDENGTWENTPEKHAEDTLKEKFGDSNFVKSASYFSVKNGVLTPVYENENVPYYGQIATKLVEKFNLLPVNIRIISE